MGIYIYILGISVVSCFFLGILYTTVNGNWENYMDTCCGVHVCRSI